MKERFQLALPELVRFDPRALLLGGVFYSAALPLSLHAMQSEMAPLVSLSVFPLAKLFLWSTDVLNLDRLYSASVRINLKAYRKGREQVRRLHRKCDLPQGGFLGMKRANFLFPEDRLLLERIEQHIGQIERQFSVLDPFVQRHVRHILGQVIEQALQAMEVGQKLCVLLEYLSKENLSLLEAEEHFLRQNPPEGAVGPLGTLHAQTCRFKAQQIANVKNAQRNSTLYRAQLASMEAGLGNIRGRMASMASLERSTIPFALEELDTELSVMTEGLEMASRVVSGDSYIIPEAVTTSYGQDPRQTQRAASFSDRGGS